MSLVAQLRDLLAAEMRPHSDEAALAALDVMGICVAYANWSSRYPPPGAWRVHVSAELSSRLAHHPDERVEKVLTELRDGTDLEARLSRDVRRAVERPGRRRVRSLDLLLNDWGVHHLHLGERTQAEWVERTRDLLFVAFADDDAYAIDLRAHGSWSDTSILRIIADNWPAAPLLHRVHSAVGLSADHSDERRMLRSTGVAVMFEHDGRVHSPRTMLSLSGTALWCADWARSVIADAERAESGLLADDDTDSWHMTTHADELVMRSRDGALVALAEFADRPRGSAPTGG